ncbi:WD40 repeat-like protein [Gigaspora margarita]|uniref:WD40 repeat-like protein n=1 Tax=Gigaspora margarita TaxID=4874 RepID=A0A8H3ZZ24_GIGMA|nr:WD40 repeat-like protein [Gigaspora margarita]
MTEDGILLFTLATDGRIAIWDISHYIHRVNCLALHQMTNLTTSNFIKESYMVVTGGEDNAIAAIILEFMYHESKGPNSSTKCRK